MPTILFVYSLGCALSLTMIAIHQHTTGNTREAIIDAALAALIWLVTMGHFVCLVAPATT